MTIGVGSTVVQSPGGRSLSQLKNEVCQYVQMPDDTEVLAIAGNAINNGIRKLNSQAWEWMATYQDISMLVGTSDYKLRDNFKAAQACEWLNSSRQAEEQGPRYLAPKDFLRAFPDSTGTGEPWAYTVFNAPDTMYLSLSIAPSQQHVNDFPYLRLRYYRRRWQRLPGDE